MVEPTTPEETLQILKNIKEKYEEHHCVNYTDEALEACVKLTDRYISDRNFPDKAIDALDEAGSRVQSDQCFRSEGNRRTGKADRKKPASIRTEDSQLAEL